MDGEGRATLGAKAESESGDRVEDAIAWLCQKISFVQRSLIASFFCNYNYLINQQWL